MAEITFGEAYEGVGTGAPRRVSIVHLAGGVVSLGLIVGIGLWGGKIILRDVTGVPVVRAMSDGPMRVAPETPGGEVALHAGLTVNDVAAAGEAAPPEDRLVLAPQATDIAAEDLVLGEAEEAEAVAPLGLEGVQTVAAEIAEGETEGPMSADDVLALADRIAAEAQARDADAEEEVAVDPVASAVAEALVDTPAPAADVIAASVPGVSRSIRPSVRPAGAMIVPASVSTSVATAEPTSDIPLTGDLPAGTKLVQLGAYDTADLARADWARIAARFADYMGGKSPVIQQAESGGRTFFRLRADGFDDISDARRFCAVLMADNAACIPVVIR